MYLHHHDEPTSCAIWIFHNPIAADWEAHFDHLRTLATWSGKTGKRAATILIAPTVDRPDAKQRTQLSRLTEAPGYDPYVAFVTPSAALRAVLTMFGWVQKAPRYEMNFFGSSDAGVRWLEDKRGERLGSLQEALTGLRGEFRQKTGQDLT